MKLNFVAFVSLFAVSCSAILPSTILNKLPVHSNSSDAKIWAVLVAGSNEYNNYRHQADICHSYQILHGHGIPDERIIVMMYDDIADNPENPTPGVVINHPDGEDVYKGVLKDYTKDDVTPQNFLKVLQGDSAGLKNVGSGKVVNSGPNDHIFVYFADHGAPGLIAFPSSQLEARTLNDALESMYKKKRYAKMVVYIEACESGSMFENLLAADINIFATTASNPDESAYACYYDDERQTYLGDVYSVNWMEDSDQEELSQETLTKQFNIVRQETNTSHVMEYGDVSIGNMKLSEFQGRKAAANVFKPAPAPLDPVPSEDVPLAIVHQKLMRAKTVEDKIRLDKQLKKMIRNRNFLRSKVIEILSFATNGRNVVQHLLTAKHRISDYDCYEQAVRYFDQECFDLSRNAFALRMLYTFVNLCHDYVPINTIRQAMDQACDHPTVYGIL